jgi:hypothetical protein
MFLSLGGNAGAKPLSDRAACRQIEKGLHQASENDLRSRSTLARVVEHLPRDSSHAQLASDIGYVVESSSSQQQVDQALVRIILFCARRGVGFDPGGGQISPREILRGAHPPTRP